MAIDQLMFGCQPCAIGYHNECLRPEQLESGDFNCCCVSLLSYGKTADDEDEDGEGRVNDNLTTGRKRAGRLNPILPGMTCEWAGLRYAGGGIVPIVGCSGNTIAKVKSNKDLPEGVDARGALHHGPDKTTMNNAPGLNLHRICEICHHRWHALNDKYYPSDRPGALTPWLPVDGERRVWPHDQIELATFEERLESEKWWETRTEKRPEYPFGRLTNSTSSSTLEDPEGE